ncbi:MAG TPA: FliH/SctL family protein [Acidimicrobiales bacterium]|nr:FliH/SctL family protein [Acidimicrobiales bacterium]
MSRTSVEPTTAVPPYIDMGAVLPELSSPQERYDHGFKRGYMAGYTEGARQAEAERASEIAAQKSTWSATMARATALLSQLASATDQYVASFGTRDLAVSERVLGAAFSLAEAVVGFELRARPERALEMARALLAEMPAGPAIVRANPVDEPMMSQAAASLRGGGYGVSVVADPSVGPGGCIVTSGGKTADARIEASLDRAREAFCASASSEGAEAEESAFERVAGHGWQAAP